jgi:hypothetical protein
MLIIRCDIFWCPWIRIIFTVYARPHNTPWHKPEFRVNAQCPPKKWQSPKFWTLDITASGLYIFCVCFFLVSAPRGGNFVKYYTWIHIILTEYSSMSKYTSHFPLPKMVWQETLCAKTTTCVREYLVRL